MNKLNALLFMQIFTFNCLVAIAQNRLPAFEPRELKVSEMKKSSNSTKVNTPQFTISKNQFSNTQDISKPFIVFEFEGLKANAMKGAILSKLSEMYKSPKDVIANISDNIISIEGYDKRVFKYNSYYCDIQFILTIEFKDGKVRYNNPIIKQMFVDTEILGIRRLDSSKTFSTIS